MVIKFSFVEHERNDINQIIKSNLAILEKMAKYCREEGSRLFVCLEKLSLTHTLNKTQLKVNGQRATGNEVGANWIASNKIFVILFEDLFFYKVSTRYCCNEANSKRLLRLRSMYFLLHTFSLILIVIVRFIVSY